MSENKTGMYRFCMALYIVYGLTCVTQFSPLAMLVGTVALAVAIIAAHIGRGKAKGTWYETHFQWLVRTFWIGGAVYMPVMTVVAAIVIFTEIDQTAVLAAVEAGETSMEVLTELMLKENKGVILMVYISLVIPFTGWWLYRCVAGARRLMKMEPVPDPERWI